MGFACVGAAGYPQSHPALDFVLTKSDNAPQAKSPAFYLLSSVRAAGCTGRGMWCVSRVTDVCHLLPQLLEGGKLLEVILRVLTVDGGAKGIMADLRSREDTVVALMDMECLPTAPVPAPAPAPAPAGSDSAPRSGGDADALIGSASTQYRITQAYNAQRNNWVDWRCKAVLLSLHLLHEVLVKDDAFVTYVRESRVGRPVNRLADLLVLHRGAIAEIGKFVGFDYDPRIQLIAARVMCRLAGGLDTSTGVDPQLLLTLVKGSQSREIVSAFADGLWSGGADQLDVANSDPEFGRAVVSSPDLLGAGRDCMFVGGSFGPNWAIDAEGRQGVAAVAFSMSISPDDALAEVVVARRVTVLQLLIATLVRPLSHARGTAFPLMLPCPCVCGLCAATTKQARQPGPSTAWPDP